jgi:hypothetical protein
MNEYTEHIYRHYLTTISERDLFVEREMVQKHDSPQSALMVLAVNQEIDSRRNKAQTVYQNVPKNKPLEANGRTL